MGNLNADGTRLWLSGRYSRDVYLLSTTTDRAPESRVLWAPHAAPLAFSIVGRYPVMVATSALRPAS
ncbi:hypothetical protein [Pseudonocardia sp. GCM10023141]|uniref:hypothetical protein n=1 Tax=Pseudonocardia sp. GCM10023141 TaxID=3252653 RepID=UPI00360ED0B7